ncbi:MAG: phage portal protein [Bacteroidales bacterium]
MGILRDLFKKKAEERSYTPNSTFGIFSSYTNGKATNLSAVYRCVEVISSSVAQLPLEPYRVNPVGNKVKFRVDEPEYQMLNRRPCKHLTRYEFIKLLVSSMLLDGNGYAMIERDGKGKAVQLHFIPAGRVIINETAGVITYTVTGVTGAVESCNMIHLKNFSKDGIQGVSTIRMAADTLGIAYDSESYSRNWFKSGGAVSGILSVDKGTGNTNPDQVNDIRKEFEKNFGSASGQAGGVAVIVGGQTFTPIKVSPVDAQLLESRKFNVVEICRFFGVSPVKCFDLSQSSYATVEATQLAFLTDTLSPLMAQIELEFVSKIFMPSEQANVDIKFDSNELLRGDKAAMGQYYTSLFNIGVLSQNDIRKGLDLPVIEGGDTYFIQGNLSTPDKIKAVKE